MNSLIQSINRLFRTGLIPVLLGMLAIALPAAAQTPETSKQGCASSSRDVSSLFDGINRCPQADAGQDLPIQLNQPIPLDASRTVDVDGQRLTFE